MEKRWRECEGLLLRLRRRRDGVLAAQKEVEAKPWKTRLMYGLEMEHSGALAFAREVHTRFAQLLTLALQGSAEEEKKDQPVKALTPLQWAKVKEGVSECLAIAAQLQEVKDGSKTEGGMESNDKQKAKRTSGTLARKEATQAARQKCWKNDAVFVPDVIMLEPRDREDGEHTETDEVEQTDAQEKFTFVLWDEQAENQMKQGRLLDVHHDVRQLCDLMRQVHLTVQSQGTQVQVLGDAIQHVREETVLAEEQLTGTRQLRTSALHTQALVVVLGCVAATALLGFVPVGGFVIGAKAILSGKVGVACALGGATYVGVTSLTQSRPKLLMSDQGQPTRKTKTFS